MNNVILLRFGELHLKGKNKGYFERVLLSNIKKSVEGLNCKVLKVPGRFIVKEYDKMDEETIINKLVKVFGLVSLSKATELATSIENIQNFISQINLNNSKFRVSVKRADKSFPIKSIELEKQLGAIILKNNIKATVSLKDYQVEIVVDIRENKTTYITTSKIDCWGGMPYSTAGKGILLLSGGIDSPVAGYMMAKRGMEIQALHFHSFPYTSELAKQKVIKLANIMSDFCGKIKLYCCPFTQIQEEIHKHCAPEFTITIMRIFMMRIAAQVCLKNDAKAIITGENLGQVASQTLESMTITNNAQHIVPVFRPLIGFDKQDIVKLSQKIGTFETSIMPYEDCCTVFLPKNPVIKPKIEKAEYELNKLNVDFLIKNAVENIEIINC